MQSCKSSQKMSVPFWKTWISWVVMQIMCLNFTEIDKMRSFVSIMSVVLFSTSVISSFFGVNWSKLCVSSSTSIPPTSRRTILPVPVPAIDWNIITDIISLFYLKPDVHHWTSTIGTLSHSFVLKLSWWWRLNCRTGKWFQTSQLLDSDPGKMRQMWLDETKQQVTGKEADQIYPTVYNDLLHSLFMG